MSKKMKRVAFDSSSHVPYEDARARFKHQTLLQDFMELQQETEGQRNKLMALKQKKLTLQAEVRFLRQRYKFLMNNKSSTPQEQVFTKQQPTRVKKSKKEKANFEKQATLRNIEKEKAPRSIQSHEFDLNLENALHVKEQSIQRAIANQRVRINGPKTSLLKDDFFRCQESLGQTQKPVIDLNQICREEDESQEQCEPFDLPPQVLIRNGTDERPSICRTGGSGLGSVSGSRGEQVKRKISWQDPVALKVLIKTGYDDF